MAFGGDLFKSIQSRPPGTSYRSFFGGTTPKPPTNMGIQPPTSTTVGRPAPGYTQAAGPPGINQYAGAITPVGTGRDTGASATPTIGGGPGADLSAPYTPSPVGTTQPGMDSYHPNTPPPGTPYVADPPGVGGQGTPPPPGGGAEMSDAYWANAQAPDMPWYQNDGSIDPNQRGYIGKTPKSEIYGRPGAMMTPRGPGPFGGRMENGQLPGGNRMNLQNGQPMGRGTGLGGYEQALADWGNPSMQGQMIQTYGRDWVQQQVAQMEQVLASGGGTGTGPFQGQMSPQAVQQITQMLNNMKSALANNPG